MKKPLYLLLTLLLIAASLLSPAYAASNERSVEITLPASRFAKTDEIELTIKLSALDDTVESVTVFAPGFEITDSRGNSSRNHLRMAPDDLPESAFTASGCKETVKLQWKADDALSSGNLYVAIETANDNKIIQTEDGGYLMVEPVKDAYCFAMDEKHIAFGEDEAEAAEILNVSSSGWLVPMIVGVILVAATVVVIAIVLRKKQTGAKAE